MSDPGHGWGGNSLGNGNGGSSDSNSWGSGDGRGGSDGWGSNGLKVDVGLSCWIGLARCVMHILLSGDLLVDILNGSRGGGSIVITTSITRGIVDVGLSSRGSITASISGGIMDVGLGSWVELSSNIKRGWESSTNGGNSTSVSNASISAIGRGGSIGDGWGWGSSNANWAKGLITTSSKVLSLG